MSCIDTCGKDISVGIIVLDKFFINQKGLYIGHIGTSESRNFNNIAHELGLVHIEGFGQYINIQNGIDFRCDKQVHIFRSCPVEDTLGIVCPGRES